MKFAWYSEPLGVLFASLHIVIPMVMGADIYRAFRDLGEGLVQVIPLIRAFHGWLFVFTLGIFAGVVVLRNKFASDNIKIVGGLFSGYFIGLILIYTVLNSLFFLNVVIILPYILGSGLLTGVLMQVQKPTTLLEKSAAIKLSAFALVALILMIPNIPHMAGLMAKVPDLPNDFGSGGPYSVTRYDLEQDVNSTLRDMAVPEFEGNRWYTYVYIPENVNGPVPVHLFLHGHSGTEARYYDNMMRTLSSRGVLGIYAQYPSEYDAGLLETYISVEHPWVLDQENSVIANIPRYLQEWDGITQALAALNSSSRLGDLFSSLVPAGYDLGRLMISGHSLGGGMILYISTLALTEGWGQQRFVIDMEAGWVSTLPSNMTILPDHTLVNIVAYQDDIIVPACIPSEHFERIRTRDGSTPLPNEQVSFIVVRSDFHGFPRDLANHYSPTDLIQDNIYHWGVLRRWDAMGQYLVDGSSSHVFMEDVNMGTWSDGTSFIPLYRTKDPLGLYGSGVDELVNVYISGYCTTV